MGVNKMTGVPWHIETLHSNEEKKRHKSRCKYYNKSNEQCELKLLQCTGSAHCNKYKETYASKYHQKTETQNQPRFNISKESFSSEIEWQRYNYLISVEMTYITKHLTHLVMVDSLCSETRNEALSTLQKIYNIISLNCNCVLRTAQKKDLKFLTIEYIKNPNIQNLKIAIEKLVYCKINQKPIVIEID